MLPDRKGEIFMSFTYRFQVDATLVSNEFIDRYLAEANGEYVKVYLYLLRHKDEPVSLEKIADGLNHTEADIRRAAAQRQLPIVKSKCPADGHTSREDTKAFLAEKEKEQPGFKLRLFGALRRSGFDGWGFPDTEENTRKKGETLYEETV